MRPAQYHTHHRPLNPNARPTRCITRFCFESGMQTALRLDPISSKLQVCAMQQDATEELLILTKTYPSPSASQRETTCVAAVNNSGELRRLFPVPFRLLEGEKRFQKWEFIRARVSIPNKDHRPESRRIDTDSIQRPGKSVAVKHGDWSQRLKWIEPHVIPSFSALEARRQATGQTLGFLRPDRIVKLEITRVKDPDWTEADKAKLSQDGLFDSAAIRSRP